MKTLLERDLNPDPIQQFSNWYAAARRHRGILQAEAMCLSTLSPDGFPAGRMVLLKEFDPNGFVFYTNFKSAKGQALLLYSKAALTFFWETMERQVRIVGEVEVVSEEEADAYFASRPRLSQIGAWASHQSDTLKNRAELDRRFDSYRKKFAG
ncbi:MAG: pyridoxal 5'-phosphate synthase, partial [Deltaproteobacteria bacterium]|nr:pyridoxal 5'-phosphate synthase [Deltaproteobacteria bacterium]